MDRHVTPDPAEALRLAKAAIAATLAPRDLQLDPRLGGLTLRPHQVEAVGRVRDIMERFRGALLADAVGLGKTYVALAVAREHRSTHVICPAALQPMWESAARDASVEVTITSTESLSRGGMPAGPFDLVVVDEAHHFRTRGTRRYEVLADVAQRSRLLLMSATPLHNSRRDLLALLALFAGSAVDRWSDEAITRLVVRRDAADATVTLPDVSGPHQLAPAPDDDCLDAILALPPTIPAADEGVAQALTTISLVHLWTSSRAALRASVQKRQARAIGLRDAVASGHLPTAAELATWSYSDETLQLAFPLFDTAPDASIDIDALSARLDAFVDASAVLLACCRRDPDPDASRVELLRALRRAHPGARCVAFSQYAHTVSSLGRRLRDDAGVAVMTAQGGRIASGAVPREYVLSQFTADAPPVHPAERIGLLLTTDLLSEGIDLRGASVVVHLDLPWNPARIEQREGRLRRLGSRFEVIHVYTFVPPTAAERRIELERRLADKVRIARAIVGGGASPFGRAVPPDRAADTSAAEALRARVALWRDASSHEISAPALGGAQSASGGWIAAVTAGGVSRMVAMLGGEITEDPHRLLQGIEALDQPAAIDEHAAAAAVVALESWLASRRATAGAGDQSPAKRAVLDRLNETVSRTPRHRWAGVAARAQRTRQALARVSGVGAERVLGAIAQLPDDDDAWLRSLEMFGQTHARPASAHADMVAGIIVLQRVRTADDATPE